MGLSKISFEFPQGKFVAFVGLPAGGKSTVLKLLGGVLIPDEGLVLIPPHLRCLHVSQEPLFFRETLCYNLRYGVVPGDPDGHEQRIISIMKQMLVPEKFHEFLNPENKAKYNQVARWGESLSLTQKTQLNICRAFVSNPEVLILHKPTVVFDDVITQNTFEMLRRYVKCKGLDMDPESAHMRRPRTCVITTGRPQGVSCADIVFKVSTDSVVKVDDLQTVTGNMLQ